MANSNGLDIDVQRIQGSLYLYQTLFQQLVSFWDYPKLSVDYMRPSTLLK